MFNSWPRTAQQMGRRKKRKEGITFPFPEDENPLVFYNQPVPCHLPCKDPESSQAALSWQQVASLLLKLVAIVACAIGEQVWWEYELVSDKRLPSTQSNIFLTWLWWDTNDFLSWVTFEADSALPEGLVHRPSQILSCTNSRIRVFMLSSLDLKCCRTFPSKFLHIAGRN